MEGLFDTMEGFSLLVSACLLSRMCGGKVSSWWEHKYFWRERQTFWRECDCCLPSLPKLCNLFGTESSPVAKSAYVVQFFWGEGFASP